MAVNLQTGFIIDSNEPVDSRFVVNDQAARLALAAGVVYEGLWVYQKDNDTTYVLTDASAPNDTTSWTTIGSGGGGGGNADGQGYHIVKGFTADESAITATEESTLAFATEFTIANGSDETTIGIDTIDVSKVTGTFASDQLPSIPASKLIGTIELDRLNNTLQTIGGITLPSGIDSDTHTNYHLRLTDVGGTETWSLQEDANEGGIAADDNVTWTGVHNFTRNTTIGNATISTFAEARTAATTDLLNISGSVLSDINRFGTGYIQDIYYSNNQPVDGNEDEIAVREYLSDYRDGDGNDADGAAALLQEAIVYDDNDTNFYGAYLISGREGTRSSGDVDSTWTEIFKASLQGIEMEVDVTIDEKLNVHDTLTLNRTDAGLLDIIGDSSSRTGVTSRIRGFRGTTETWAIEGYQASSSNNNDGRLIIKGRGDNTMNQVFRYDPADNPITFGGTNQVNAIIDIKNIDGPDDFAIVLDRTGLNLENVNDSQGLNFFNPAGVLEPAEVSAYFRPTELHLQHGASGTPGSVNISGRNISPSTGNKELLRIYAQGRSTGSSDFDNTFGDIQFFGDTTGEGKIRFRVDGSADEDSIAATDTVFEMLSERVDALKPLALNSRAAAPTEMLTNGLMWYDSTNHNVVARINGANENLSFGASDALMEGAYSNVVSVGSIKSSGDVTVGTDSYAVIQYKIGDNYYYRVFGFGTPDETIVEYTGDGTENDTTIPTDLLTDGKYTITDTKNY